MIFLGIDQGLANIGFGIINYKSKEDIELLTYGVLEQPADELLENRILMIKVKLERIIREYHPVAISCEKLFFTPPVKGNRNKSSSIMTTNMVTGIIYLLAAENEAPIVSYVPGTIKKAICGHGRATKEEIIDEISKSFNIECKPGKKEHICDAIAMAITGAAILTKEIEDEAS